MDTKQNQKMPFLRMKKVLLTGTLTIALSSAFLFSPPDRNWKGYGSGPSNAKFIEQDHITQENVGDLQLAWKYDTEDQNEYQFNPIIVDRVMYILAKDNSLIALDAETGKEKWIHANLSGISRKGVTYWESKDKKQKRLIFTLRNSLQAIDAKTGKSILSFGKNGAVDLRQGLGVPPDQIRGISASTPGTVFEDIIIMGSATGESYLSTPGHVRAYSVITGELLWKFNTIPQPGEYGYETWPPEAYKYVGGVNCWGEITVDEKSGIAYIPLGSPTYDYYGADRHGANLFGNCLLALDARTGKRIWHFQTVHHDLWDYDLTSAPQLITVNHNGKRIDAVAVATKQGFLFAFDRKTGEPLWPVEERPVPASDVPGEAAWPTQPFPTVLEPFNRQTVTEDDISPIFLTDQEYKDWKERVRKARKGLYTPPSTEETISMPGAVGGANWGNTAANPSKGLFYVLTQEYPSFYKLTARPPAVSARMQAMLDNQKAVAEGKNHYSKFCSACHGADLSGTAAAPSLLSVGAALDQSTLNGMIQNGSGRMPPVQHISDTETQQIFAFLKSSATAPVTTNTRKADAITIKGPVVASGGAPGETATRTSAGFNPSGADYPEGIPVPKERYYTGYGLGYAFILNPPWSTLTAYDLNTGKKVWARPVGEDEHALKLGHKNTGVPTGTQRNSLIVTSNGLIFATVTNGQIFALDADTGEILWSTKTPLGIASISSMYQIKGQTYLIVNATTAQIEGWNLTEEQKQANTRNATRGGSYYVYTLPKNKK
jgi:quinoprotein glucose dehydrogenase